MGLGDLVKYACGSAKDLVNLRPTPGAHFLLGVGNFASCALSNVYYHGNEVYLFGEVGQLSLRVAHALTFLYCIKGLLGYGGKSLYRTLRESIIDEEDYSPQSSSK